MRHGETEWNLAGRWQGHLDSPLTTKGIDQAKHLNTILQAQDLDGFTARISPQGRAVHTAALALGGVIGHMHTDPDLAEITIGDWTGWTRAAIHEHTGPVPEFAHYDLAPGGEGYAGLRQRCVRFLENLNGPAVVVTHGMTSRMLRMVALDMPTSDIAKLPGGQGVIFKISDGKHSILK